MRCPQPVGERGSLKWIQRAVNRKWTALESPILDRLNGATAIEWLSPLKDDEYAEYRDASFLERLGLPDLSGFLDGFWPRGGPQWDALAVSDTGHRLIIEAKAHIGEFLTPATQASEMSLERISASLNRTAARMGLPDNAAASWHRKFYQYTNRLAHLAWLRENDVDAKLVMVNFVGDADMPGETTEAAWHAAYMAAEYALGIARRHRLSEHVLHVYPDVTTLAAGSE